MKVGAGPESGGISAPPELGAAVVSPGPEGPGKVSWPVDMESCSSKLRIDGGWVPTRTAQ